MYLYLKIDDIDFIKTRKRNELHPVLRPILEKVIKRAPNKKHNYYLTDI